MEEASELPKDHALVAVGVLEQKVLPAIPVEEVEVLHFGKGILLVAKLDLLDVEEILEDKDQYQALLVFHLVHREVLLRLAVHWVLWAYFQAFLVCLNQDQLKVHFL